MTVVEDVLAALADPTRRDLLEQISRRGDATATMLAEDLPITRQAVVQHLAVPRRRGPDSGPPSRTRASL